MNLSYFIPTKPDFSSPDWELESKIIGNLRFPLIILIVLFHLYGPGVEIVTQVATFNILATIFGANGIAKIGVPAFFLISGYLFFYKIQQWNRETYFNKLRKRIKTLLIPYLLWIAIPIFGIVLMRIILAFIHDFSAHESVVQYLVSIGGIRAFWDASDTHPYIVPLWYVRDLMVCAILSPLIYFLIRKLNLVYLLILAICFLTETWFNVTGFCIRACFFFSLGAYFSINKKGLFEYIYKSSPAIYLIAISLLIISSFFNVFGQFNYILCNLFIFFGIWAFFKLICSLTKKYDYEIPSALKDSVFFIFAFHCFPLPGIGSVLSFSQKIVNYIFPADTFFDKISTFIITPSLLVMICVGVFLGLTAVAPKITNILTGSRAQSKISVLVNNS